MFPVIETNMLMKSVLASRCIVAQGKSVRTMRVWCVGCCSKKELRNRGQGEDRGVLFALSLTNQAHSSREIVPEERGEALTNDEQGRGVLGLQRGRRGWRQRFDKLWPG